MKSCVAAPDFIYYGEYEMLKKQEKEQVIKELADNLSKSTIIIATDYRGLTAKDMVQLRRKLRESGIEYKVAKNTLTRFAAEKTGQNQLGDLLSGPVAIAFGYDDELLPAKILNDFIKSSGSSLKITGGLLGDKMLTADDISNLASIPSKEILIARFVGQLAAPLQSLHTLLSSPMRGLIYALQARSQQIEGN
jgi:large subunit ribosomal protein L10